MRKVVRMLTIDGTQILEFGKQDDHNLMATPRMPHNVVVTLEKVKNASLIDKKNLSLHLDLENADDNNPSVRVYRTKQAHKIFQKLKFLLQRRRL